MKYLNHSTVVQQIIISLYYPLVCGTNQDLHAVFNTNGILSLAHILYIYTLTAFCFHLQYHSIPILPSQVLLPNYYILHFVLIKILRLQIHVMNAYHKGAKNCIERTRLPSSLHSSPSTYIHTHTHTHKYQSTR